MKIVILDGYTSNPGDLNWDKLKILGDLTVYEYTKNQTEDVVERLQDCEIALTNKTVITKEIMEVCPKLRYIGVLATGYNVVDMKAAAERGITVTNVPGYSTQAVAQQAFALLLEICSHVAHHSSEVHSGRWSRGRDFCFWDYPLVELDHKTAGIIGFGQTGKAIGRVAKAFGMRVITCGSHATEEGKAIGEYVAREQLLRESDVIFLACPLNEETKDLICAETIAQMKDGVILINTSRGGTIVEKDLAQALKSGKIYGAGVDVVSVEPAQPDNPLLSCDTCVITPHIAWATKEARGRLIDIASENVRSFLDGAPVNVVAYLDKICYTQKHRCEEAHF